MNRSVLARPNLKLFLVGAILLLAVQDLVTRVHSQGNVVQARLRTKERLSDETLHRLIYEASQAPTPDLCMQLSEEFTRRGEMKRALFFLRRAEQAAELLD